MRLTVRTWLNHISHAQSDKRGITWRLVSNSVQAWDSLDTWLCTVGEARAPVLLTVILIKVYFPVTIFANDYCAACSRMYFAHGCPPWYV